MLTKEHVKQGVRAFAELAFKTILSVYFRVTLFDGNVPYEIFDMIFINLTINTLVQIILTLIKGGFKIMYRKLRNALDREQQPRMNNKTRDEAKVKFERGELEHP